MLNLFHFSSCVVGVFVLYEFSPMVVQYTESRRWALDTSLLPLRPQNRDLTIRQRRRQWKRRWKIDFESFTTFPHLYKVTQLLERREVRLELKRGDRVRFRERKWNLSPCRSRSQVNSKFGPFTFQLCRDGKEIYKKVWCTCSCCFAWRCRRRRSFVRSLMTLVHGRPLLGVKVKENLVLVVVLVLRQLGTSQVNSELPGPLYQNEVKCTAIDVEMIFHSHTNKTHFHKKGCALGLILKVRVFGTRKGLNFSPLFFSILGPLCISSLEFVLLSEVYLLVRRGFSFVFFLLF